MTATLRPATAQIPGQFNGGQIRELRPVMPDSRTMPAVGALFYWAHAWTPGPESTIPEHPHRGFEIISVVLEGALEHYDSLNRQWVPLGAGGVQVIQSGSGLSHSERLSAGARMFQIWLDPNLAETFGETPAYADYAPAAFAPQPTPSGLVFTHVAGGGGPVALRTPGAALFYVDAPQAGTYTLPISTDVVTVVFAISGQGLLNGTETQLHDALVLQNADQLVVTAAGPLRLFAVQTPARPAYRTYVERTMGGG